MTQNKTDLFDKIIYFTFFTIFLITGFWSMFGSAPITIVMFFGAALLVLDLVDYICEELENFLVKKTKNNYNK